MQAQASAQASQASNMLAMAQANTAVNARTTGQVKKVKNGIGIVFSKDAKVKYSADVVISAEEMQRSGAEVGNTVSFVMEFKKFEGVRGHQVMVEADAAGDDDGKGKGKGGKGAQKNSNYIPRPGDWSCPKCKVWNFARNPECRSCHSLNPKAESAVSSAAVPPPSTTLASQLWQQRKDPPGVIQSPPTGVVQKPPSGVVRKPPGVVQSGFKARARSRSR